MAYHFKDLLGEVVVDEGCLEGQVAGRADGVTLVLWGLDSRLTHGQQV